MNWILNLFAPKVDTIHSVGDIVGLNNSAFEVTHQKSAGRILAYTPYKIKNIYRNGDISFHGKIGRHDGKYFEKVNEKWAAEYEAGKI